MIYLSAGHYRHSPNADPGAVSGNFIEADLTIELRNMIIEELRLLQANFITDHDDETLKEYIERIQPGTGSVVCELHFNSSANLATGTEVIIKNEYNGNEKQLALEMSNIIADACKIINRGVKTESQSHRGKLGILHTKAGISVLAEICFINNPIDMKSYEKYKKLLAGKLASILKKYDAS